MHKELADAIGSSGCWLELGHTLKAGSLQFKQDKIFLLWWDDLPIT